MNARILNPDLLQPAVVRLLTGFALWQVSTDVQAGADLLPDEQAVLVTRLRAQAMAVAPATPRPDQPNITRVLPGSNRDCSMTQVQVNSNPSRPGRGLHSIEQNVVVTAPTLLLCQ